MPKSLVNTDAKKVAKYREGNECLKTKYAALREGRRNLDAKLNRLKLQSERQRRILATVKNLSDTCRRLFRKTKREAMLAAVGDEKAALKTLKMGKWVPKPIDFAILHRKHANIDKQLAITQELIRNAENSKILSSANFAVAARTAAKECKEAIQLSDIAQNFAGDLSFEEEESRQHVLDFFSRFEFSSEQ